jgi:plastocyanin
VAFAPGAAIAHTKTVYPGGPVKFQNQIGKKYGAGVDNFMINRVTINVGDTVVWSAKAQANGFHTIDFPAKGGSDQPLFVTGAAIAGAKDAGGSPFWFNGLPSLGLNPALFAPSGGPTYNGSSRADSGLPLNPKAKNFTLKFTKAGVYKYFCDVHPGMVGEVIVKKTGQKVPSAKADAATLAAEEAAYKKTAKKLTKTTVKGNNVSLGAEGPGGVTTFAFFPGTLQVKTGTTVKFSMPGGSREVHTASFGPSSYLTDLSNSVAGPAPNPAALYPSDPPGSITLNASSHGNGFASTGALDQDNGTPQKATSTIKFTQAGTYHFICLIHPFMHGTVVVTP